MYLIYKADCVTVWGYIRVVNIRVAVWELVVALVGLHSQFEMTGLAGEASLAPGLWEGGREGGREGEREGGREGRREGGGGEKGGREGGREGGGREKGGRG